MIYRDASPGELYNKRPGVRVQKKSRLHGSEPKENSALYDVFEGGSEICINNPVSAKFFL